uniref:AMP-binding protein n=1 Tax=Phenylobacterium sp. TaxID=1871053 RepID=UPI00286D598B
MNLHDLLAARFPDDRAKPAFLLADGSVISYGAFEDDIARTAALLIEHEVEPGDRIALQSEKSVAAVVVYLATLKVGAVFLPLNTAYTESEVDYFLDDAEPVLFVEDAEAFVADARSRAPLTASVPRDDADLASIIYTSGTTGRSKGVVLSAGRCIAAARDTVVFDKLTDRDEVLAYLPLAWVGDHYLNYAQALVAGFCMACPESAD